MSEINKNSNKRTTKPTSKQGAVKQIGRASCRERV